jgi:CubicO group peptidase (beta-lactamase class C family)
MRQFLLNRRRFLLQAGGAGILAANPLAASACVVIRPDGSVTPATAAPDPIAAAPFAGSAAKGPVFDALDSFVPVYMKAMNSPGLTLGLVDKAGAGGSACYGYSNLETQQPVTPELLFQIGSISKSFLAIVVLQLREEGKLDLDRRVLEYMPRLPIETPFGAVTLHHMLTHTSGLPGDAALFPSNPTDRYRQSWKPGERFLYSNFCFDALGRLVASVEGRPFHESLQQRILDPLGMTDTASVLTDLIRPRTAESYQPQFIDRPTSRMGKLAPAPKIDSDSAAGSIASTPGDMRRYMQMLLNRGAIPGNARNRRILKDESFALFSKPHVKAEEFGPTASYGYGIAVDTLDGHTILRHTGGMVSFMSAMHVDIDGGFAAFASINAQQGYRPNPVAQFAIKCLRAQADGKALPKPPAIEDPAVLKNPKEYEGTFYSADGKTCRVVAGAASISLQLDGREVPLEGLGGDRFVSTLAEYSNFAFVFHREEQKADAAPGPKPEGEAPDAPIIEITHGSRWFLKSGKPAALALPERLAAFSGKYVNDSPWLGSFRVVELKGKLSVDGEVPLLEMGESLFRLGSEPDSPETMAFFHLVDGHAQLVKFGGNDYWRTTTEGI